jgi:hypothetical protein
MADFFRIHSPAGDYVDKLIQLGAKTPEDLEETAKRVQSYLAKQKPEMMEKNRYERRAVIAVVMKFKEALIFLRDEVLKCSLAETTLEQMVHSVVKDKFGEGDSETKALLRKREKIEAIFEGEECAPLKGGEVAKCLKAIDEFTTALEE